MQLCKCTYKDKKKAEPNNYQTKRRQKNDKIILHSTCSQDQSAKDNYFSNRHSIHAVGAKVVRLKKKKRNLMAD